MFECTIHPFCLGTNISSSLLLDAAGTLQLLRNFSILISRKLLSLFIPYHTKPLISSYVPCLWVGRVTYIFPTLTMRLFIMFLILCFLPHNYSYKVSVKEYNLGGGEREEGRVKPITTAPSLLSPSPSPSPFPLSLPPPRPSKITFKETIVNTEPYGSILIHQVIILNVFLVVRDPQCIDPFKSGKNIFSYILKFTWQPGGQSDIV